MAFNLVRAGKFTTIDVGKSSLWQPIAEVYEIGALTTSREMYEITSHGAGLWRNYIPGLYSVATITLACNYLPDNYGGYWTMMTDLAEFNIKNWYRILVPLVLTESSDKEHRFEGYISEISPEFALDDRLVFNMSITVDGPIYFEDKTNTPPS